MKRKYDYVGALATNVIFLRDSKTKIKRVLRKLVREAVREGWLSNQSDVDKTANELAKKWVP